MTCRGALTDDRIGYIAIDRLADREIAAIFQRSARENGADSRTHNRSSLNGGGSEPLGLEIAGSILDQERVYAKSQYRNGPRHTDLDVPKSRICRPKDPWQYVAPVIVLQGQRTMSFR